MKVKQYIVTYNNSLQINNCLESIFSALSIEELDMLDLYIINNHTNFIINKKFEGKVKILHNSLRPNFSTGHLSRNWNQAIINGFQNLNNPDCDFVIANQDDVLFKSNYVSKLIEHHKRFNFIQLGDGDSFMSFTPNAIKRIGLFDERFCNIGYQEADYFLRALIYHPNWISINDEQHLRKHNPIEENNIIYSLESGYHRREPSHMESMKFHNITYKLFKAKWGVEPEVWDVPSLLTLKPQISSYLYYPYFEKNIETLEQQNYQIY
jgi:hypothetical protein